MSTAVMCDLTIRPRVGDLRLIVQRTSPFGASTPKAIHCKIMFKSE